MDLHFKQEIKVGAMVLVGIALFVAGTMFLSGRSLTPAQRTVVQFTDAAGLKRGSPVRISGMQVGRVENIRLEGFGQVMVTVSLERGLVPRQDAKARVVSVGLAGDVAIELNPGSAAEPLAADQTIPGEVAQGFAELGTELATQAQQTLEHVDAMLDTGLVSDLRTTLQRLNQVLELAGDTVKGPTAELSSTMGSLRQLVGRLDSTLGSQTLVRSLANMDTLSSRLVDMTTQFTTTGAELDSLLTRLNRGEGSLGKALADQGLYDDARKATQSLQQLLDELRKHPGKITVQVRVF